MGGSAEPTMSQLLEQMPTSLGAYQRPANYDRDATMANATGVVSWRKGQGFKEWEKLRLNSPEVRRKADVCQLCEYLRGVGPSAVRMAQSSRELTATALGCSLLRPLL